MLENTGTVVRMADGTVSNNVKGFTHLKITRADNPNMSGTFKFIVAKGRNNLLGRPVLKELWSSEYRSLVHSAEVSKQALCDIYRCQCEQVGECTRQATMTSPPTPPLIGPSPPPPTTATATTDTTQPPTTTDITPRRPIPTPPHRSYYTGNW